MLDFQDISSKIPFKTVLLHYDVAPEENRTGELKFRAKNTKGEEDYFVVNLEKNLFLTPETEKVKGGVINFVAWHDNIGLYQAAKKLSEIFLEVKEKKEIPNLTLNDHESIEKYSHLRKFFDFGKCSKGIMSGCIAFKCFNESGEVSGYIGHNVEKDKWIYPKDFSRTVYNIEKANTDYCILVCSPYEVLHIHDLGYHYVCGLLGKSATERQLAQLVRFKRILWLSVHQPTPAISQFAYVKAPKLDKTVLELDDIKQYF